MTNTKQLNGILTDEEYFRIAEEYLDEDEITGFTREELVEIGRSINEGQYFLY